MLEDAGRIDRGEDLSLNDLSLYVRSNARWVALFDRIGSLNEIPIDRPRGGVEAKSGSSTQDDTLSGLAPLRGAFVDLGSHWRA
jgi:hypothetical protein